MDYTLGDKAIALLDCMLWWRVPNVNDEFLSKWTLVTDDIVRPEREDLLQPGTEYHIGAEPPKPARVLSELERELLETLDEAMSMLGSRLIKDTFGYEWHEKAAAAIAKAKGEA